MKQGLKPETHQPVRAAASTHAERLHVTRGIVDNRRAFTHTQQMMASVANSPVVALQRKKRYTLAKPFQRIEQDVNTGVVQREGEEEAYASMGKKSFWKETDTDENEYVYKDFQEWSSNYKRELEQEIGSHKKRQANAITIKKKLDAALKTIGTVAHYTSASKLVTIQKGGGMLRSYDYLIENVEGFEPKTQDVDVNVLGTSGFVFGYLEHDSKPQRTGGRYGDVRLVIDPNNSYYKTGLLMLNDYVDYELPDLVSDDSGELKIQKRQGKTLRALIEEQDMKVPQIEAELGKKYRDTKVQYGKNLDTEFSIAKKKNSFVGSDIPPGVGAAVAVEALRMDTGDPQGNITSNLSSKSGAELIETATYQVFRPQAMIPTGTSGGVPLNEMKNSDQIRGIISQEINRQELEHK